ncbi:DUF1737 domain-containing protein [Jannaschia seohaensis]|uniref:DUF1737 domain-containing protein n=1 Tax=Jannaschia seohaensis TaxID=475081 RepID=A0A2Y9BW29_9RHOB|nr:DUF1737 domain-containing protein [Jannaschia seohaensis]PWJ22084.1 hypothetical protein BCF38_101493 [Jannaschia seohaensis]SSA38362.1 hypothetical protein SAMN05421539_101493 [Jannaschia seohaensis]
MAKLYRLLTAEDDSAFCHKVSDALAKGWELYGSPAYAHDPVAGVMRCAQAVTKVTDAPYDPDKRLGQQ